jgi:hypothetical protein
MTTALQCMNSQKPYTLVGFEPGIFCSVGGPTYPVNKWIDCPCYVQPKVNVAVNLFMATVF